MRRSAWEFEAGSSLVMGSLAPEESAPVEGAALGAWRAIERANLLRLSPAALQRTFRAPINEGHPPKLGTFFQEVVFAKSGVCGIK